MKRKVSQNERILKHLVWRRGITTLDAYDMYGVTRLAARIADLRGKGLPITTKTIDTRNRYGDVCTVADYSLEDKDLGKKVLEQMRAR